MPVESDIDGEAYRGQWVNHPYTQLIRRKCSEQRKMEFENLKGACRTSADPRVVLAYARWEHWLGLERLMLGEDVDA